MAAGGPPPSGSTGLGRELGPRRRCLEVGRFGDATLYCQLVKTFIDACFVASGAL
jgi:hypothetical protein